MHTGTVLGLASSGRHLHHQLSFKNHSFVFETKHKEMATGTLEDKAIWDDGNVSFISWKIAPLFSHL